MFDSRCSRAWALLATVTLVTAGHAHAETADVLPRGAFAATIAPTFAVFNERWSGGGQREQLTHDLDGVRMDNTVFPDLAELERVYNMADGTLTVGTSHLRSLVTIEGIGLGLQYGITNWLSVGVFLPIINVQNSITTMSLDPGNIGKNPGDAKIKVSDAKYLPVNHDKDPRTKPLAPLTKEDVGDILHDDFGYQRLDDFHISDIGDFELGLKARFLNRRFVAAAASFGFRAPTGTIAPLDNILAVGTGNGCWATSLGAYLDIIPFPQLKWNVSARYTFQLPDEQLRRVPRRYDRPITDTALEEKVWRDLGDYLEVSTTIYYRVIPTLTLFVGYLYYDKQRDDVRGNRGLSYDSLMILTDGKNHLLSGGLTFSTLPLFERKRAALPLDATLSYERSIYGKNRAVVSNVISLLLTAYFKLW